MRCEFGKNDFLSFSLKCVHDFVEEEEKRLDCLVFFLFWTCSFFMFHGSGCSSIFSCF